LAFRREHPFITELRQIVCDEDHVDRCVWLGRRVLQPEEGPDPSLGTDEELRALFAAPDGMSHSGVERTP
jgi:hypothetical protein